MVRLRSAPGIFWALTGVLSSVNAQYYGGYNSGSSSDYGSNTESTSSYTYPESTSSYSYPGSTPSSISSPTATPNSASKSDIPFSTFDYNNADNGGKITVSLNVPSSGNDLYFHLSGPAKQSWIAFGIGSSMSDNPLIFLAYRSSNGNSITVSPRLATQHSEPQHDPVKNVQVTVLEGSGIIGGNMVVNAKCTNCRSWSGNSINVKSTTQPFIVATYSGQVIQSDDVSYRIQQHSNYQQFTMNVVEATGKGGVPIASSSGSNSSNSSSSGVSTSNYHLARTIHAILMLVSFLFLYPLGVIYLRVLERVWLHWLNQSFATLCIAVAVAIGIGISIKQKIHPNLLTPHQLIGLVAIGLLFVQLTLGFIHHRIYAKTQRPTPLGKIHRFAGPFIISLGLFNGFLGFRFAHETRYLLPYGVSIAVVAVILVLALWLKGRGRGRGRKGRKQNTSYKGYAPTGSTADIPLTSRGISPDARGNQAYYDRPPRERY